MNTYTNHLIRRFFLKIGFVVSGLFIFIGYANADIDINSNCICSPGMDGSISVTFSKSAQYPLAAPFIIKFTDPEGTVSTVEVDGDGEDEMDWPQTVDFDELSLEGLYEIDITNAYGCETNFTYPLEKCGVVFPYIKRLMVDVTPGITVYDATWEVNGDCISYTGGSIPAEINDLDNAGLDIYFFVTEPLDLVETNVELIDLDFPVSSVTPELINSSQNQYKAIFPSGSAAAISGKQRIRIVGKTSAGKPLLDLRAMSNDLVDCVVIPQLSENCEVSTPIEKDKDDVHEFEIGCIHLSFDITIPSGQGVPDGAIDMTITGGGPLYQISWFNVNTHEFIASTEDISELKDGTYQVIVSDNNGCTVKSDEIHLASCGTKTLVATYNGDCSSDYEICVEVIDAFGNTLNSDFNFHWFWEENGIEENSSEYGVSQSCLDASLGIIYDVKVDDLICGDLTLSDQFSITGYDPLFITSFINNACGTLASGMIQITVEGGLSPYQYNWSNGLSNSNSISGLNVGDYTVTVTDACQNTSSETYTVGTIPVDIEVNPIIVNSCSGGETGSINLEISGGFEPFNFEWNDDNNSTTQNIKNIPAGTYSVIITDLCENEFNYTFTVEESPNVTFQSTVAATTNQITGCNGQITITPNSNIGAPYTYAWSNGSTASQISNACAGNQTVTITDDFGCESILEFDVPVDCQPISISTSIQHAENCNDGFIKFNSFSNGVAPFSFEWSPEVTVLPNGVGDLTPGEYTLTITDALGCSSVQVFQINGLAAGLNAIETAVICQPTNGQNIGSGEVFVNFLGDVNIEWSTGATTAFIDNLAVGTYSVTVTSIANPECSFTEELIITEDETTFSIELQANHFCSGETNSTIGVTTLNGTAPYTFQIDGLIFFEFPLPSDHHYTFDNVNSEFTNVQQGNYTITATDHCGAVATANTDLYYFSPPIISSLTEIEDYCNEENPGSVTIFVEGGTPPYNYEWSNGSENSPTASNLPIGNHCVTVTDSNGCQDKECFEIYSTISITANSVYIEHATTETSLDGAINWDFSGAEPFSFNWEGPNDFTSTSEDLDGLIAGEYNATITDGNGCTADGFVTIYSCSEIKENGNLLPIGVLEDHQGVSENENGFIILNPQGGLGFYSYLWEGPNDFNSNNYHITNLAPGDYHYTVTDGCQEESGTIEIKDCTGFEIEYEVDIRVCANEGSIIITGDEIEKISWEYIDTYPYTIVTQSFVQGIPLGQTLCARIYDDSGCFISDCWTIEGNNGTMTSDRCVMSQPIIVDGFSYEKPSNCVNRFFCDGELFKYLPTSLSTEVDLHPDGQGCTISLFCGTSNDILAGFPGEVITGYETSEGQCYETQFCRAIVDLNISCSSDLTNPYYFKEELGLSITPITLSTTNIVCKEVPVTYPGLGTILKHKCFEQILCENNVIEETETDESSCCNTLGYNSPCCPQPSPPEAGFYIDNPSFFITNMPMNNNILEKNQTKSRHQYYKRATYSNLKTVFNNFSLYNLSESIANNEHYEKTKLINKIYPNPFKESLNIELNPNKKIEKVDIILYNILGQKVTEKKASLLKNEQQIITLDLSRNISKGLYELIIIDEKGTILHSEKVVHLQ